MIERNYEARKNWTFDPSSAAVLLVDVQNSEISPETQTRYPEYYQRILHTALPNQKKLVDTARAAHVEVIYTVIESLTTDGRDRSLDHKMSGIFVPKGSNQARIIDDVAPGDDDIVLSKTSSGAFNSTILDYLLRNLDIRTLIVCGFLTDQCVDMAIRDAADRGYHVVCVNDACAAYTQLAHEAALRAFSGYCRTINTVEISALLSGHGVS